MTNNKDIRNCRCCGATYSKPTDYWCELSTPTAEIKGFCEFCDRGNTQWYIKDKDCHNDKGSTN